MGVNHLGHFLLAQLLIPDMQKAKGARCVIVGSITGNTNTVGGGLVYPKADLGLLKGMEQGGKNPIAMMDGKKYDGAKAYKDSKVMNMMTVSELHRRYHKKTGITFSSMYPGCIAETQLFREVRKRKRLKESGGEGRTHKPNAPMGYLYVLHAANNWTWGYGYARVGKAPQLIPSREDVNFAGIVVSSFKH